MTKHNDETMMIAGTIVILLMGLLAVHSAIGLQSQWGQIYILVFFIVFLGLIASLVPPLNKVTEFIYIKTGEGLQNFWVQVCFGLVVMFAFVGKAFFGVVDKTKMSLVSFLSPISAPPLQTGVLGSMGFSSLSAVGMMSIAVSEFEESLRAGFLRPTFSEWLSDKRLWALPLFIIGIFITFFLDPLRLLGIFMMAGALLATLFTTFEIENKWLRLMIGILCSAFFFSLLHTTAYGTEGSNLFALLFQAFLFATIADSVNGIFAGSTVSSKVAHTGNNAVVSCISIGVPVYFAFFVVLVHIGLMWLVVLISEKR